MHEELSLYSRYLYIVVWIFGLNKINLRSLALPLGVVVDSLYVLTKTHIFNLSLTVLFYIFYRIENVITLRTKLLIGMKKKSGKHKITDEPML